MARKKAAPKPKKPRKVRAKKPKKAKKAKKIVGKYKKVAKPGKLSAMQAKVMFSGGSSDDKHPRDQRGRFRKK